MARLLHIIASPREDASRTLNLSQSFVTALQEKHPEWIIDELNLAEEEIPPLTMRRVDGKYVLLSGKDLYGDLSVVSFPFESRG